MIILDAFFRFSGIGLMLIIVVFSLRDYRVWQSTPYLIGACLSTTCLFLGFAPEPLRPTGWFLAFVRFGDIPHLVFVWFFALSLFKRAFHLSPYYILFGITYCAPILWLRLSDYGIGPVPPETLPLFGLSSLLIVGHLCIVLLKGRSDDLSLARRRSRLYFVGLILIITSIASITDALFYSQPFIPIPTIKIISIWLAVIAGIFWMLRFNIKGISFESPTAEEHSLSIKDKELHNQLHAEMVEGEAYKDYNLTIPALAKRLGVTQHRLRALINTSLGFQNFSQYVNGFRLDATKLAFSDPNKKHLPILTIALDCGFRSISPFNRTFKNQEGMTPTEYRESLDTKNDRNFS